jgi:hypothetical protein
MLLLLLLTKQLQHLLLLLLLTMQRQHPLLLLPPCHHSWALLAF